MTKAEIITNITEKINSSKIEECKITKTACEAVIDCLIDEVKKCLVKGEKLTIKGFIGMEVYDRSERMGRNPKTGEVDTFPASKSIKCKVSKAIKDAVNGK